MSAFHLLFTRDFDAEIAEERRLAARSSDMCGREELDAAVVAARREGFEEGRALGVDEGRAEAMASLDARRAEMLGQLVPAVEALVADRAAHRRLLEGEMAAFVHDLCERVFPELVSTLGPRRVAEEIDRVAQRALGSPSLEIRLSPALADAMTEDLAAVAAREGRAIRVVPDPALGPSEVQASWLHGRSRYSFAALCRAILALIPKAAPSPHPEAGTTPHDA